MKLRLPQPASGKASSQGFGFTSLGVLLTPKPPKKDLECRLPVDPKSFESSIQQSVWGSRFRVQGCWGSYG